MITTIEQLDRVRAQCRRLVMRRALVSGASAAIPAAGAVAGAVADIAMLHTLLPKINRAFGLDPTQIDDLDEQTREQVMLLAGKLGNILIGRLMTRELAAAALKRAGASFAAKSTAAFVPVVGSGVAATMGFAMMKFVGNAHINECYGVVRQMIESRPSGPRAVAA